MCVRASGLHDPPGRSGALVETCKQYEENGCGENYLTEGRGIDKIRKSLPSKIHLKENLRNCMN